MPRGGAGQGTCGETETQRRRKGRPGADGGRTRRIRTQAALPGNASGRASATVAQTGGDPDPWDPLAPRVPALRPVRQPVPTGTCAPHSRDPASLPVNPPSARQDPRPVSLRPGLATANARPARHLAPAPLPRPRRRQSARFRFSRPGSRPSARFGRRSGVRSGVAVEWRPPVDPAPGQVIRRRGGASCRCARARGGRRRGPDSGRAEAGVRTWPYPSRPHAAGRARARASPVQPQPLGQCPGPCEPAASLGGAPRTRGWSLSRASSHSDARWRSPAASHRGFVWIK